MVSNGKNSIYILDLNTRVCPHALANLGTFESTRPRVDYSKVVVALWPAPPYAVFQVSL